MISWESDYEIAFVILHNMSIRNAKLELIDKHISAVEQENFRLHGDISNWQPEVVADYKYWVGQRRRTFRGNKVSRLSREPAVDCEACQ